MRIIPVTLDTVTEEVAKVLYSNQEASIYCIADAKSAVVGTNHGADLDAIARENVKLIQISHEGGTIVLSPGDVDIGIFTKGYSGQEYRDKIIKKVIKLIEPSGAQIIEEGNDVLVDGKKVIGHGSRMYGEILYTAIHISINADLELIKKICTKPTKKIPGSLSDYGIKAEDLKNIIYEVLG